MPTLYRYEGFYFDSDDECWLAVLGGGEFTRGQLLETDPASTSDEQMAEVRKALAELPADDVEPKRGQRKKPRPIDGDIAAEG